MNFRTLLPHLAAIIGFLVLSSIYFFPILQGKQIMQHDIAQWEGMSKEIQDHRDEFDEEALWTRSMFGGMPAYQISVLYPSNLLKHVNSLLTLGMPTPMNYIFLALLGFYLLMISLKIDFRLAAAGAIGFAFASYNLIIIMAGHNSKMHAIALFPFVIMGVLMVLRGRLLLGTALTALFLGLEIYANHLQITYYLALIIIILMISELVRAVQDKELTTYIKKSAVLLVAVFLAILPNLTSLWATYEYGKFSTRGSSELTTKQESSGLDREYALRWSYGISESMTILIPNFMGGPSQSELDKNSATYKALVRNGAGGQAAQFVKQTPLYWGSQPLTSGPNYNGAILVFLFVFASLVVRGAYKWWILASTVLFIMLSWGKNFPFLTDLFFNYFPGYNKFRAVSMMLSVLAFTIPFLAIFGLHSADTLDKKTIKKQLLNALYVTGGLSLIFLIVPSLSGGFYGPVDDQFDSNQYQWLLDGIREDRASVLRLDALRSLVFIGMTFGLLYFYFVSRKMSSNLAIIGLAVLILADMWFVSKRYLANDDFQWVPGSEVYQASAIDQQIMSDPELGFRVMNMTVSTFNDASTSYFHHSIGGYHGAKLKRYQELIESQISQNNMAVLDMLNAKYFIMPGKDGAGSEIQVNPGAVGPAWFVKGYEIVENADEELASLSDFRPSDLAIIDKRFSSQLEGHSIEYDSAAVITLSEYQPNKLIYNTNSVSEQVAIFSEIYYPKGWNAYVDGEPAEHFRVNYVLRGMVVPPGQHTVEFRFEPSVYSTGENVSLAGSVLVLLFVAFAGYREFKEASKGEEDKTSDA